MKKLGLIAIMIVLSKVSFAQDFDYLVSKKQVECSDISYNSGLHFIRFIQANKIDSAKSLLKYWETKCGMREPIYRAKILLALQTNEFNDTLLTKGVINYIFNYQNRMDAIKSSDYSSYDNYKSHYGFIPPGQEFDKYTQNLALSLTKKFEPETIEYLLAEFYGVTSDTIFTKLQSKTYKTTPLTIEYENIVNRYSNMSEFHLSGITGIWIPTGRLKKLGAHPEIGFQIGAKHKKMNYDLTLAFRFLNSANDYYAKRKDSGNLPELTNHFFGGYMGFEVGRDIYTQKGHELQLTGGIGFDGFDALEEDKTNNLESASIFSYNFNFGLGYRYYITNTFYLGLRTKYNMVDYSLNNVIDFTGYPITVQFIVGGVNNIFRNHSLKALKYKMRK